MSVFSETKDVLLDQIERENVYNLRFPLKKLGHTINNYNRGEFIVVGGRRTSGKSSFILNNYVISPAFQRVSAKKNNKPFDLKIVYMNTRKTEKANIERMILNYNAHLNKGNKIGVPSLYGYEGNHAKVSPTRSRDIISKTLNVFDVLVNKDILAVTSGPKSLSEIDTYIRSMMEDYGDVSEDGKSFTYKATCNEKLVIIAIDDITGITNADGRGNFKNDNAHRIGIKLRELTRIFNVLIVLGVPSTKVYSSKPIHESSLEEIAPYDLYCDRSMIQHNPVETGDKNMLGYDIEEFIGMQTGINYYRSVFVASNYMGPSGIYYSYFLFPENGYMLELPSAENALAMDVFMELVDK